MEIKRANVEDAKEIEEVNVATWKVAYAGLLPDEWLQSRNFDEKKIEAVKQSILKENNIYLKAVEDGKIVGYLNGGKSRYDNVMGFEYEVYAVYVLKEYWGKGAGQALFRAFREIIKQAPFYLYLLKGNEQAFRFYQKQGGVINSKYNQTIKNKDGILIDEVFVGFNQ